jgi:hypothetical protein
MTKSEGNPNDETRMNNPRSAKRHAAAAFDLRASTFIRHSSFDIRHSARWISA